MALNYTFIVNHLGNILSVKITGGNASSGKLDGDKGYLRKVLVSKLRNKGIDLMTSVRKK